MIHALRSDWIRTKNLRGTWVYLGLLATLLILFNLFLLRNQQNELLFWYGTSRYFTVSTFSLATILSIFAVWRYTTPNNHGIVALNTITQPARWNTFCAAVINSTILAYGVVFFGYIIEFLFATIGGRTINFADPQILPILLLQLCIVILFFTSLAVLVRSTVFSVLLAAVWYVIENLVLLGFSLLNSNPSVQETVKGMMFFENLTEISNGAIYGMDTVSVHAYIAVALWLLLAVGSALLVIQRRDIH